MATGERGLVLTGCGHYGCACMAYRYPKSGTPDLTPGVLEDGGSARVGDLTPPGPDVGPTVDPPSSPCMCAHSDGPWPSALSAYERGENPAPRTDAGADPTAADPGSTGALAAPASLTDRMRVERCRVLLHQWELDRAADMPYLAYVAVKRCEDELREALGDQT
jgi:hypothetical protein